MDHLKTTMIAATLLTAALAMPLAQAEIQAPAGVTLYPLCVWWYTTGGSVYTPGVSVNRPPAHVTIDPVYVVYVPPSHGEICVGSLISTDSDPLTGIPVLS